MKKLLPLILLLLVAVGVYWFFFKEKKAAPANEKAAALVVSKHSATFNSAIDSMMQAYFKIKDAFVNADSTTAKTATRELINLADTSILAELSGDTTGIYMTAAMQINDVKSNAEALLQQ